MKKHLQLLVFLAALLVPWVTQAQIVVTASSPFTENFDSVSSIPTGWTQSGNGTWTVGSGVYSMVTTAHSGSNNAKITHSSSGNLTKLITPLLDLSDFTSAVLTFWMVNPSWGGDIDELTVYYRTSSTSSWTQLYNTTADHSAWTEVELTILSTSDSVQVAFEMADSYGYGVGIDDVTISAPPTCPKVENLTVDSLSVDWAALSWREMGSATSWIIEYDTVNFTPGTGARSTITATDTAYTLTGLDTATTYYLYLHADCGAGDTSLNRFISFSTLNSLPATVPYSTGFETSDDNAWTFVNGTQPSKWYIGTAEHSTGSRSMYVSSNNGASCSYADDESAVFVYRDFNITEAGEYAVSYDWKCQGESYYYDFLRVLLAPAGTEFTPGNYPFGSYCYGYANAAAPAGWVDLTGKTSAPYTLAENDNWSTVTKVFNLQPGSYRLVLSWTDDANWDDNMAAAFDNLAVVRNTCPQVQNLQASHVTSDSIILTWNRGGEETEWLILTGEQSITANDSTYIFSELTPDSTYQFAVYAVCGADDTSLVQNLTVHTPCVELTSEDMPYRYGFEDATGTGIAYSISSCWARKCNSTSNYPYPYSIAAHTGSYGMSFYGYYRPILVLPATTISYDSLTISFWGKRTSTSYTPIIELGTMTDINDFSSFTPYDTLTVASNIVWNNYESTLSALPDSGRIAIKLNTTASYDYTYFYLDDVVLDYTPSCPHPVNFTKDFSNGDTVSLSWNEAGSATAWDVCYGPSGFNTDTVATNVVNCTDSSVTITGLPMGANYDFYVRSVCSSTDVGSWYGPVTVLTGFVYAMSTSGVDTLRGCGYIVTDNGGADGNYAASCNATLVVLPTDSTKTFTISGFNYTESCCDHLYIYDGIGTSGTVLFQHNSSMSGTVSFGPFTSDEGAVTIRFTSDGSVQYDGFQIALSCVDLPNCVRPNQFTLVSKDDESATLRWHERGTATAWQLEYGPHGFTPGDTAGTVVSASTNPFTLTGLTPNTYYDVYVKADCSGEYSLFSMLSFRTACTPIDSLPYTYGFEDCNTIGASGTINACWTKGMVGSTSTYPYPSSSAATGSRSLMFYGYFSSSVKSYAVMPLFEEDVADLQVKFKLRAQNTNYAYYAADMKVGVMTDPSDPNTFSSVATCSATSSITWDSFKVNLAAYTGTGRYIAFMAEAPNSTQYYDYVYLDDVTVKLAPPCGDVENLAVNASALSAIVTWEPSMRGTHTGANVEYRIADDSTASWTSATATGNYAAITGLTSNTNYVVRVQNTCSEGDADWAEVAFSTNRLGCEVPDTTVHDTIIVTSGMSNTSCVPVNSGWGNSLCQTIYTADQLNNMGFHQGYIYGIRYTWTSSSSYDKLFSIYVDTTNVTAYGSTSDYISMDTTKRHYSGTHSGVSGSVFYAFDTPFYWNGTNNLVITTTMNQNGSSQYSTGFNAYSTQGSTYQSLYYYRDSSPIDADYPSGSGYGRSTAQPSITLIGNGCSQSSSCAPMPVAVGEVGTTTAELLWAPGATETSWNVSYRVAGDTAWTSAGSVSVSHHTLTNLISGSNYEAMVSMSCGTQNYSAMVEFTTECAMISTFPYVETFNNWGTGSGMVPNCWNRSSSYSVYPYLNGSYDVNGSGASLYFYLYNNGSNVCRVTLPEIDTTVQPINNLQVTFSSMITYASYNNQLEVGVMSDPNLMSTFVPVDTVDLTATTYNWNEYEVPLNNYSDTGTYITLRTYTNTSYSYYYIDDLIIETIPTCPRPDSIRVDSVSENSVTVAWHERGTATNWMIEYGPTGFTLGTGTRVSATTNPYTITGLTSSFEGEFYVYSVCSSTDTSTTRRHGQPFTTSQIPATLPYSNDFTDTTVANGGFNRVNSATNAWYVGSAASNGTANALYISSNGGTSNTYSTSGIQVSYAYRDITIPGGEIAYSYDWQAYGESSYDYIRVWLAPLNFQFTAGQLPDGTTSTYSYMSSTPAGWISLDGGTKKNMSSSWQTYSGEAVVPAGTYHLVFMWGNDGSGGTNPPAAIDNIYLSLNTCPKVRNLQDTAATASTVDIAWTDTVSGLGYQVEYGPVGFAHGDPTATSAITTQTGYTLTGLSALTNYDVYVRHICSGTDTGMWNKITVQTAMCDNASYGYSFDSTMTAGTSSYAPMGYSFYNYGYVQTLIDSANLASLTGDITAMAFQPATTTSGSYYTNMDIYLANVPESDLSSGYINPDSNHVFVQVTDGADLCYTDTGWQLFGFDTSFTWDGHSNLLVTVNRRHGTYASGSSFQTHTTTSAMTRYSYTDSYAYTVGSVSGGSTGYFVGDLQFISCGQACGKPVITSETHDYQSATVAWNGTGDNYEVELRLATVAAYDENPTPVIGTTYTFSGLQPATMYNFRVRQDCTADSLGYSDWVEGSFTTDSMPCFAPTDLHMTAATNATATLAWTAGTTETAWEIHVFNSTFDQTYQVTTNPATLTGFTAGVTYNAAIRALCGDLHNIEGEYGDTIQFTTDICDPVSSVHATANGVDITVTWTAGENNTGSFEIEYGEAGYGQGEQIGSVNVNGTSYTFTDLEPETDYGFHVRAICAEDWTSVWSSQATATTGEGGGGGGGEEGIYDVNGSFSCTIFPNPASDATTISVSGVNGEVTIAVVDMNGRTVSSETVNCAADCVKKVNVSNLTQGAYFVRIYGENVNSVKKLIVK